MDIQLHNALHLFAKWAVGRTIRGQPVRGVELIIEHEPGLPDVFHLEVVFRENPVTDESSELNLLQRVFSEIPYCARLRTEDVGELRAWMVGLKPIRDEQWRLSDE